MSSAAISGQGPGNSWRNSFHRLVASIEELFRVAFGFMRGARPAQARRVQMKYTSVWAGRATKHGTELTRKKGWRAVPPALAEIGYGCFLPDLTRFTTMQCGAARRCSLQCERTCALIICE